MWTQSLSATALLAALCSGGALAQSNADTTSANASVIPKQAGTPLQGAVQTDTVAPLMQLGEPEPDDSDDGEPDCE
jgi:hypothetical protein